MALYAPELLRRAAGGPVVDLGFGRLPLTTVELAHRLWDLNSSLEIIGVELDPARVAAAQAMQRERLRFVRGGFNLSLPRPARLIRAMNVLRQYPEAAVPRAHAQLAAALAEGGLLLEGTCGPDGAVMVVHLLRKREGRLHQEGLLLSGSLRQPFSPDRFPPRLPKSLIHRMVPGEPIFDFFAAWRQAAAVSAHARTFGTRQHFVAAGRALAERVPGVQARPRWLRRGHLLWLAPPSSPPWPPPSST